MSGTDQYDVKIEAETSTYISFQVLLRGQHAGAKPWAKAFGMSRGRGVYDSVDIYIDESLRGRRSWLCSSSTEVFSA